MDLLIIGDCSIDQYMDIEDSSVLNDPENNESRICFLHGSKITVERFKNNLAGNACHVGVACSKLGLKTMVYTELGDDEYADQFIKEFKKNGIDVSLCRKTPGNNTNVHAIIWHASDRTIFSYHEPRKYNLDLQKLVSEGKKPKWIYYTSLAYGFENFQEDFIKWLNESGENGGKGVGIAYNPGSIMFANMPKVHEFLKYTDVLFVNLEEALKILGKTEDDNLRIEQIHKQLHQYGVKMSVITEGSKGASVYDGVRLVEKSAILVKEPLVDKTGAGDTYAASFLSALNYGKSIETAMEWGNKNSANTVKFVGCIDGLLSLDDLNS